MSRNAQRTDERTAQRFSPRAARTLACAAVALPALLVAGCSSDDSGDDSGSPAASHSAAPSPQPVKYKELPDACKTVSKGTVKDLTPKTDEPEGKSIPAGDPEAAGSCLWSGLDKYDYRQLTVSLKRFDSDTARGSGDKLATAYAQQQVSEVTGDKDAEDAKSEQVTGIGEEATSVAYKTRKSSGKKKSEDFREERLVIRDANVVVTVEYSGAGFEDGKTPGADEIGKGAEKAGKEAVGALG